MTMVERIGAVVKHRTLDQEVPGSGPPVAVGCCLERVSYPQLLRWSKGACKGHGFAHLHDLVSEVDPYIFICS